MADAAQPLDRWDEGSRRTLPIGSPTWPNRLRQPRQPDPELTIVTRGELLTAGPGTGGDPGVTLGTVTGRATESIEWKPVAAQATVGGRVSSAFTGGAMGGALATVVRGYSDEEAWWRKRVTKPG